MLYPRLGIVRLLVSVTRTTGVGLQVSVTRATGVGLLVSESKCPRANKVIVR